MALRRRPSLLIKRKLSGFLNKQGGVRDLKCMERFGITDSKIMEA